MAARLPRAFWTLFAVPFLAPETLPGHGAPRPPGARSTGLRSLVTNFDPEAWVLVPYAVGCGAVVVAAQRTRYTFRHGLQSEAAGVRVGNRWADWLAQAERDMEQARASREGGRHEWACFAAQQAAEKAAKALHLRLGQEAWGHVVAKLLAELPVPIPTELVDKAKVLDNFYVPSRYPNGHPEGAPFEHFGPIQSGQAIRYAGEILDHVRRALA